MNGIIVIDKPFGKTSHDMVYFVRKLTGIKKVGHTGTLDPAATGVLPVCIGNATKVCDMLTNADKAYKVTFILGMITDTQDAEGEVLAEQPITCTKEDIIKTIKSFEGEIKQIPPMYSAVKVGGKKLYELARAGVTVERKERVVTIKSIDILEIDEEKGAVTMTVECSKGTYIRTLCEDIGIRLGCGAYVNNLQRIKSGVFSLDNCFTLEELLEKKEANSLLDCFISTEAVFADLPEVHLGKKEAKMVKNGVAVNQSGLAEGALYRVYGEEGFLAVSKSVDGKLYLEKAFWNKA